MEQSISEIVKICSLSLKDKDMKKQSGGGGKTCTQVTVNASDSLLYTCQSLFYTQLINAVKKATRRVDGREQIDPLIAHQETFNDPEDLVYDIL